MAIDGAGWDRALGLALPALAGRFDNRYAGDAGIVTICYPWRRSKHEAIARIQSTLPELTAAQAEALAEIATAWTRAAPAEDDATLAAIREGLAEADRGEFVDPAVLDGLLARPWG
jgi:predicted transcriptional regulator